jgi:hypothetical protein
MQLVRCGDDCRICLLSRTVRDRPPHDRSGRQGGAGDDDGITPAYAAQCGSVGVDTRQCSCSSFALVSAAGAQTPAQSEKHKRTECWAQLIATERQLLGAAAGCVSSSTSPELGDHSRQPSSRMISLHRSPEPLAALRNKAAHDRTRSLVRRPRSVARKR